MQFKAVNMYMKSLSELEERNSNRKLWDMVFYELFSVQYYLSVQNYLALYRVSIQLFELYKIIMIKIIYINYINEN